ncbi:hypothetical protein [Klebsiella grimontii]|uniref:hypothetical protein n=1 Tax=Klebsiella grimontii TaxID=2058152 RepID=UPI0015E49CAF|nr:hypothetical protein [Klebsiella grimontii]QLN81896.1 hypothetical protein HV104_30605 [Klebsiella grimontii]
MTNNQLTDEELQTLIIELQQTAYRLNGTNSAYLMSDAIKPLRELQERRKAAMDSEPVFTLEVARADYKGQKLGNHFGFITLDAARELKEGNYQLYAAQSAPIAPAAPQITIQKSTSFQHAEKLATDAKELAERVQRNDVKALTTSEEHRQLRDLVMMVKMLCRTVRKYNPESQQAANFTAYLQKEGLISAVDCLRDSDPLDTESEDRRG